MSRLPVIVFALVVAGCAAQPAPVAVEPVSVYEAAKNEYADAVIAAQRALEAGQLSFEGRATITETLRRSLGYIADMTAHVRQGTFAEARSWAACARASAKLAREQIENEVHHTTTRPPAFTERL